MTATGDFASIVEDRGRQATRVILEAKERIADPRLSEAEADALRQVVVDQVAGVFRLAASLIRNLEGQISDKANVNELWLEAIGGAVGVEPPEAVAARNGNGHGRP